METQAPDTPRADVETKLPQRPRREPTFVAVDTEGLGDNMFEYPTVAVAFVAMDPHGNVLYKWQTYMPSEVTEKIIEPRCYMEFWNNPAKCNPEVYRDLQKKCKESPYGEIDEAWKAVSDEIDHIYDMFPDHPVVWVSNCPDYDIGRIEAYLAYYTRRGRSLRYDKHGVRHPVEDCGSGRDVLKRLFPDKYKAYKESVKATGAKHTHDCLDDALHIGTQYIKYMQLVEDCAKQTLTDAERAKMWIHENGLVPPEGSVSL